MKQGKLHFALSLLIVAPWFYASAADGQAPSYETPKASAGGQGVTNYASASPNPQPTPSKVDEPWPWMDKAKSSESGPASQNSAGTSPLKTEKPEQAPLQMEKPETQAMEQAKQKVEAPAQPKVSHTPFKLYGRIEQLSGSGGASFPALKALAPKLDTRDPRLHAVASEGGFSGKIVKSFPTDNQGNWGGNVQLDMIQIAPAYFSFYAEEAKRTQQALHLGATGAVNFQFQNAAGGKIALEPATVLFMVPMKDTVQSEQMSQMFGQQGGANPLGAMVSQMAQSMNVPLMLKLGEINTSAGGMETSVTGGRLESNVLKNDIRQLAPGVYEQQIVTRQTTWDKQTGKAHSGYGETVLRFTTRNSQQMFVQVASVNYGPSKQFLMKLILEGWLTKGQVMNTNPMSSMGGMGGLEQLFGGQGKQGASPQVPGLDPNVFKNLFGQ